MPLARRAGRATRTMPSPGQTAKIFSAARELGWDREQLYDLVEQVSGGSSVSALTTTQTHQVIEALVRAGARPGKAKKPSGRRTAANESLLITPAQRELIEQLREDLGEKWTEERYYEGACMRVIKKPRPTTAGNAERVIEMLKARRDHARRKARAR